ncbi:hypothetical protein ABW636_14695 [Aquimarina sp. 2201CG1-2-11]|uniref:hypothetical protein n=1 Tax=Aquimarina discodermiae TaxID=3231043 RepID=UPI00346228C2
MKIGNYKNWMFLLLMGVQVYAQNPEWIVNENDFQYTMSFVAFLNIDSNDLENSNDKVAAFVDNECRGVSELTYIVSENRYYAYLTVFANRNDETINFKIYDSSNDKVVSISKTENFEINKHYGDVFQAYSIAEPALNNEANIVDFDLADVFVKDKIFNENEITLIVDNSDDISNLNSMFTMSPGAKLYVGTTEQKSGESLMDFSTPVAFRVVSEDQSVLKEWTVNVKQTSGDIVYYKKDAVCYQGGAIKLVSTRNNEEVSLLKDGIAFSKQTITNGETIFSNLETATYLVQIGNISKEIIINKKEE